MVSKNCDELLKEGRGEMIKRIVIVFAIVEFIVTVVVMFYATQK